MALEIKEDKGYQYIDEGQGEVIVLLHGLFGALSNWESVVNAFSTEYRVMIPLLPIYEMPIKQAGLEGLVQHLEGFVKLKNLNNMKLMGNSLGGHVG
jgi:pimeloyl-ACP methyl ester carboxylesterase